MTQVVVGRLLPPPVPKEELSVSVIVPCKNEKGNVEEAVRRIPALAERTEIIFCDDQSTDGTAAEVLRVQAPIRTRTSSLSADRGFVSRETSGQASMRLAVIF